jgi:uncharacterized protein
MSRVRTPVRLWLAGLLLAAGAAHADLAGARKAYAAKDFEGAFQQYLEIATLGNVAAQENLAAMYVDGEGVPRDNVLGYAWATIARENGGNAAMQNIIGQLEPHLDDKARARVKAVTDQFGKAALEERLLPGPRQDPPRLSPDETCRISRPTNPDDFYPRTAIDAEISGSVFIESRVSRDGQSHHPIAWYSFPEGVFDAAGRGIGRANGFSPKKKDGEPQPCTFRYKAKFRVKSPADARITEAYKKFKVLAEAGDPVAQLYYGLLMFDRGSVADTSERPLDWYLKAAQAGLPYAQYLVGVDLVMLDGAGPEAGNARRIAKGLTWLEISAAHGRPEAKFALANYQLATRPESFADPRVFAWLEDATKAGHRDGTLYLAALLAAGPDATRRDPVRALELVDLGQWDFDSDPTAIEIAAAANAHLEKYDAAVSLQQRAIRTAARYKWDVAPLNERLGKYQARAAWSGNLLFP